MDEFDGLITFYSSHYALKAENLLIKAGIKCLLIPGPKQLSPNCGVALQFHYKNQLAVIGHFREKGVNFENIYLYKTKV